MSYRADKLMIDRHTHRGNDNTRRPKLASGKKRKPFQLVEKNINPWRAGTELFWFDIVLWVLMPWLFASPIHEHRRVSSQHEDGFQLPVSWQRGFLILGIFLCFQHKCSII